MRASAGHGFGSGGGLALEAGFQRRVAAIKELCAASCALDGNTQREVVSVCGRELLTSYGLRSLDVSHPEFRPRYEGGVWERDTSYHQGAVWAYLLGHYTIAEYKVSGDAIAAQANLEPIRDHLMNGALGTVSEIFDGIVPHTPRGAPAQAWSVACILEAWVYLERRKNKSAREVPVLKKANLARKSEV